jgi:hypothetical protein
LHLRKYLHFKIEFNKKKFTLRVHNGIFDLPAKAAIANIKQFNGKFGCPLCFHPGKREGRVQLYPCDDQYEDKTNKHYLKFSNIADILNKNVTDEKKRVSVFGFFGETSLGRVLNIPEQLPFGYMHLVLQGNS